MQFRQQQQPPHNQPRQPANAHTRASTCFSPYSQMLFANPSPFSHKKEGKTIKIRTHILIYIHAYIYTYTYTYTYCIHTNYIHVLKLRRVPPTHNNWTEIVGNLELNGCVLHACMSWSLRFEANMSSTPCWTFQQISVVLFWLIVTVIFCWCIALHHTVKNPSICWQNTQQLLCNIYYTHSPHKQIDTHMNVNM